MAELEETAHCCMGSTIPSPDSAPEDLPRALLALMCQASTGEVEARGLQKLTNQPVLLIPIQLENQK